jgi:phage terminase large subunit-like protein
MTRGERVCKFIETYCYVPDGKLVGKPLRLMDFQRKFILDIYDNPAGTTRAYLSIARKNGKSALIAAMVLAHIVGPEARLNSQIISGARSRDQAALVYKLAEKMVRFNPELRKIVKPIPSQKTLIGGAAARVLHVLRLRLQRDPGYGAGSYDLALITSAWMALACVAPQLALPW